VRGSAEKLLVWVEPALMRTAPLHPRRQSLWWSGGWILAPSSAPPRAAAVVTDGGALLRASAW